VGYRAGIHMKEYFNKVPVIVVGGRAGDFFGEYMAGGILILLGLDDTHEGPIVGNYCGTGMHGGVIYIKGQVEEHQLGKEVGVTTLDEKDRQTLCRLVNEYCRLFGNDAAAILGQDFIKLYPKYLRPYGRLYTY